MDTLQQLILARVARSKSLPFVTVRDDGETVDGTIGELFGRAKAICAGLQRRGIAPGTPILVLLGDPAAFFPTFWACQLGGYRAVPLAETAGPNRYATVSRLAGVRQRLGEGLIVCSDGFWAARRADLDTASLSNSTVAISALSSGGAEPTLAHVSPNDVALIQFSSGSTGAPKGVLLTHANLLANLRQMSERVAYSQADHDLCWLPHYHDLGLVGCHLLPLFNAAPQVKMTALQFLRAPERWLQLASRYRATVLSSTNTALKHLLRLVDTPDPAIDLSGVEILVVGAEPLDVRVLNALSERLAPLGFRRDAFLPAYGLAEASVGVCFPARGQGARPHRFRRESIAQGQLAVPASADDQVAVALVAHGRPWPGTAVQIVDHTGVALPEGALGAIRVRGPNVSSGYANDREATDRAFTDGWLLTGDLGLLVEGELLVCGRYDEVISHGGSNLFPQDLETCAIAVTGVHQAVVTVDRGDDMGQRLLLFLCTAGGIEQSESLLQRTRSQVQEEFGVAIHAVIPLSSQEVPRTSSGKVRRFELTQRYRQGAYAARGVLLSDAPLKPVGERGGSDTAAPAGGARGRDHAHSLAEVIRRIWGEVLNLESQQISDTDRFKALGGSSVQAVEVLVRIERVIGRSLEQRFLSECATIEQMVSYLGTTESSPSAAPSSSSVLAPFEPIAVIGMACRFPDADDPGRFWDNLIAGVDSVRHVPDGRFAPGVVETLRCRWGGFLDDPYRFDLDFFPIPLAEARLLDPQQRNLLELAVELLEGAGYGRRMRRDQAISVFIGCNHVPYQELLQTPTHRREAFEMLGATPVFRALDDATQSALRSAMGQIAGEQPAHPALLVGNLLNMLASRVSHELDLTGPSLALDTACSSSLVTIHLACQSLLRGESSMAIAGGVHLNLTPAAFRWFDEAGALSHTGRSRPFATDADGFVPSEGAGVVLLKPLSRALVEGDRVLAVVRGTAINNDGTSIGVMAPSPEGQVRCLERAYRACGIDPDSVSLIEAHGTGTPIGDPVELRALNQFFGVRPGPPIALGSLKSNLGHLLGAAGVGGLIKLVLALIHRQIPPSLHLSSPRPQLDGRASRLQLQRSAAEWTAPFPRRAAINGFGFGGTNCHVILEEASRRSDADPPKRPCELALLSAPTSTHLSAYAQRLTHSVSGGHELGSVTRTLATRRSHFALRAAVVVESADELAERCRDLSQGRQAEWLIQRVDDTHRAPRIGFLFPGQGAQRVGQGRSLWEHLPGFRDRLRVLAPEALLARCYDEGAPQEQLNRTEHAQPLLVAYQIAVAQSLIQLGIRPTAVLGHSVGEYSAATIAGMLQPAQALRLATIRGQLMSELDERGGMLAVFAELARVATELQPFADRVAVAAINGARQVVISGADDALQQLAQRFDAGEIRYQRLAVSHAFHSPLMQPMIGAFERAATAELATVHAGAGRVDFYSTVTALRMAAGELDAAHWTHHIRAPVRFSDTLAKMLAHPVDRLIEIGPGTSLSVLVQQSSDYPPPTHAVWSARGADEWRALQQLLAELWTQGLRIDFDGLFSGPSSPVALPTIPFLGDSPGCLPAQLDVPATPAPQQKAGALAPESAQLLHEVVWEPIAANSSRLVSPGTWVVMASQDPLCHEVVARLREYYRVVVVGRHDGGFVRQDHDQFGVVPDDRRHVQWIFDALSQDEIGGVLDFRALDLSAEIASQATAALASCLSALVLVQGIMQSRPATRLFMVTRGAFAAAGDRVSPAQAATAALMLTAMSEHRALAGRVIDLQTASADLALDLHRELALEGPDLVALRDGTRYARRIRPCGDANLSAEGEAGPTLIIGASGGVGSALAHHLAAVEPDCPLLLTGRRPRETCDLPETPNTEYHRLDVTDASGLGTLFEAVSMRHPRLRRVVVSVGVLRLGSIARISPEELRDQLQAKLHSATALWHTLKGRRTDEVHLVSSIAGCLPRFSKGCGAYGASNAFLDAFATLARADGAPWTAGGWSLWRGTGVGRDAAHAQGGVIHPLDPGRACEALRLVGSLDRPTLVLIDPREQTGERPAPVGPVAQVLTPVVGATPRTDTLSKLANLSDVERFLRETLSDAVQCAPDEIDPDVPLLRLGVTSLAAVDLVRELEVRLGLALDNTLLFEYDTLNRLLGYLASLAEFSTPAQVQAPQHSAERALPLLSGQKTFFANHGFYPALPCYIFLGLELAGRVDRQALEQANRQLFESSPALRMTFGWQDGELVQRPTQTDPPEIEFLDWRELDAASRSARLDALDHSLRHTLFDLELGPTYRLALCQLGEAQYTLLFSVHHIAVDAWSTQLFLSALLRVHGQLVAGETAPPVADLGVFWAGLSQTLALESAAPAARSAEYWRRVLGELPPRMTLPYDGDPDAVPAGRFCYLSVALTTEESTALDAVARGADASPFHAVLSCYYRALALWSGQQQLVVRVANARREARADGITHLLGSFADSLPLRVDLARAESAQQLLGRVRTAMLEAQKHSLTSSLTLASMLGERSRGGPRGITPAGISFSSFGDPARPDGISVEGLRGATASGFTQLGLIVTRFRGRYGFSWNFNDSLFNPATVSRMAQDYLGLLRGLIAELSNGRDLDLAAAPPPFAPAPALPRGAVVHQRILQRTAEVPERLAVDDGQRRLSYGELADQALQLASLLGALGVGGGDPVAILAHPSADAVVGVVGILAADACYVPIDPNYPDLRLAQILRHAGATVLVTARAQLPRLAGGGLSQLGLRVIVLDALDGAAQHGTLAELHSLSQWRRPADWSAPQVNPERIAYVMYTSGTTGQPKGVMVSHRAVSLFHDWVHDAFGITAADRFIQTSALSFGGSIRQIFSPLLAGAAVFPVPQGLTRDPHRLLSFLQQKRITIWNSVPTLWMRLLDELESTETAGVSAALPSLRWILLGGEQVLAAQVRRWIDRVGLRYRLANLYGSTETVVNATWHEITERPLDHEAHVPIGRERSGSCVAVLDEASRPCAPGESGEIVVGGPSLAAGYWRDPSLSAARFVSVPGLGGRAYRTGDVGIVDHRGRLTYLGRIDSQVQVHGNRVELSEIEAALLAHPGVKAAAAAAFDHAGRLWLVAAVVPSVEGQIGLEAVLRAQLKRTLPSYMLPHRFWFCPALPMTKAGKIDRGELQRAFVHTLPDEDTAPEVSPAQLIAEPSPTERTLSVVWRQVLGVAEVPLDADFFALGGDSILALEMLQRLRGQLPHLPRPVTLYEKRTIRDLARSLDQLAAGAEATIPTAVVDEPTQQSGPLRLALTPVQAAFVLAQRLNPDHSPTWCAQIPVEGELQPERLRAALSLAVERFPMLRAVFIAAGGTTRLEIRDTLPALPFVVRDLHREQNPEELSEAAYDEEKRRVFDLERGPLFQLTVLRLGARRWHWLVTVHHAIGDGWSVQVLGNHLLTLYDGLGQGRSPAVLQPPRPTDFVDVVRYLGAQERVAALSTRAFWRERFAEPWPAATLLPDGAQPAPVSLTRSFFFDEKTSHQLRQRAAEVNQSLFSLMATLFFRVLHRRTGQSDQVVGIATSGRDLPIPGTASMFGCFASGVPVRATLSGGSFAADLTSVSQAVGRALGHSDISTAAMAAEIPRHAGSPYPPGARFFISYMDFSALPDVTSQELTVDQSSASFYVATQAAETELSCNLMVGRRLRVNLHSRLPAEITAAVASELRGEVDALCGPLVQERGRSARREIASGPQAGSSAALIAYLPTFSTLAGALDRLPLGQLGRESIRKLLFPKGEPVILERLHTDYGTSSAVFLPCFGDELMALPAGTLRRLIGRAIEVARQDGATACSLAGALAAQTGYGRGLGDVVDGAPAGRLTTGHAATVVAVIKTLARCLSQLDAPLDALDVGVIGFGSIGQASAQLLLDVIGKPRSLAIFDLRQRQPHLIAPLADFAARTGVTPAAWFSEEGVLPDAAYHCNCLIGASSSAELIDVSRLRAGTILVDDSFPPIVDPRQAWERMRSAHDVMLVSGGTLALASAERRLAFDHVAAEWVQRLLFAWPADRIPGCRLESLLLARRPDLPSVLGLVQPEVAARYWRVVGEIGLATPPLHLGHERIPQRVIARLRGALRC